MSRKKSKVENARSQADKRETKASSKKSAEAKEQPGPPKSVWREYFESAIYTAIMFVFFITFIGRTVGVPTGSMLNTILIGDYFLIDKFIFAPGSHPFFLPQRNIRRGDIIVFKYPGDNDNPGSDESYKVTPYKDFYIKRVIGLPGETIEVRGANVLINGQVLPEHRVTVRRDPNDKTPLEPTNNPPRAGEPYTVYYFESTMLSPDKTEEVPPIFHYAVKEPYKIPDNSYFVMGDNRDNSADSRAWGPVEGNLVIGRALFVFWSKDESAPSTFPLIDIFKNTRWGRTGTMIK
ncbi:MAG TPA: signal peptidase I [Pyrinomonadaceae bacterium]